LSPSEEEYSAARAALTEAGFSEASISRCLAKPKRAYSRDSSWKDECHRLYLENGLISREEIYTTKGFPSNTNRSQTIKRFIGWLEGRVGHEVSYDKGSKSYTKAVDNTGHYDALFAIISENREMNKKTFEKFCEDRGLNQKRTKVEMQNRGVTVYGNGLMAVNQ
tara:strand:- start:6 stop:500 length:495 start_codon:yes stop_codon:yes gene_type:complete